MSTGTLSGRLAHREDRGHADFTAPAGGRLLGRDAMTLLGTAVARITVSTAHTSPGVIMGVADSVHYGIPDVVGGHRTRYAGRRTVVVGSGHSAFTVLLDLVALAERAPDTRILWAIRRGALGTLFGAGEADALPERGRLGQRLRALVERGR